MIEINNSGDYNIFIVLTEKWRAKKLWFAIILGGFLLVLGYYFLNNRPIDEINPLEIFQPVTPKSLSQYPIIDDCRQDKHATLSEKEPPAAELDAILKNASLLQQFTLRKGFSLGRIRVEAIGLPGPNICFNHFYLGIRNDKTSAVLKDEGQLQALIVKEEQLPIVGQLLYGEPNKIDYKKRYSEWITMKPCTSPSDRTNCVSYRLAFPSLIDDGQITQDLRGIKTLHRFTFEGLADPIIVHKKITVNFEGLAQVESQELIQYRTGIMF